MRHGIVVGVYHEKEGISLTKSAKFIDEKTEGRLSKLINIAGPDIKIKQCRHFFDILEDNFCVTVVGLGSKTAKFDTLEQRDERRENIRIALSGAVVSLRDLGAKSISVDPCGDPAAASEGVHLGLHSYDDLKAKDKHKPGVDLQCLSSDNSNKRSLLSSWNSGKACAKGQNLARRLMEMPANYLTPTAFCDIANERLLKYSNVVVTVRDKHWAEEKKMGAFLSVAQGSEEPLRFLELSYKGTADNDVPFALVGKGVTFDTGGISIKPSASMDEMRADMGGAACVLGTFLSVAELKLPLNVLGFIPLCENMPSGTAVKPGDVVTAMNGKTIQVDNTDAEGRLILADALCYAESFKPRGILDMATLTGAMVIALGRGAAGTYTNSDEMWTLLQQASGRTGDRLWRMPLWQHYTDQITECQLADLNNIGKGRHGGSCTAAAFLKEFVTNEHWIHLDIAGVMDSSGDPVYLGKGMTGRPTRTVVEFLTQLAKQKSRIE